MAKYFLDMLLRTPLSPQLAVQPPQATLELPTRATPDSSHSVDRADLLEVHLLQALCQEDIIHEEDQLQIPDPKLQRLPLQQAQLLLPLLALTHRGHATWHHSRPYSNRLRRKERLRS